MLYIREALEKEVNSPETYTMPYVEIKERDIVQSNVW